jgi:hypothetical protein
MGKLASSEIVLRTGTNNAAKAIPLKTPEKKADIHNISVIPAIKRNPWWSIWERGSAIFSRYLKS